LPCCKMIGETISYLRATVKGTTTNASAIF
jgi:hypothetical protein